MTIRFLDLHKQYLSIKGEMDAAIEGVISKAAFIGGEYVARFEQEFAAYLKVKHCVGVANGTDAIEIALEALNLPAGSDVLVPANSFIASSEAVTRSGHHVVFCDCDPATYTISPDSIRRRITKNTRAVIAVHLYGQPCDMDLVMDISREFGLKVIEDCAQAHGAEFKGRRVGGIGHIGTFSFYPGKNLGGYGDAGAIVTNDEALALKCRMIANHGRIAKYDHEFEGRNSRLDGLQAAILSIKLKHLEGWLERRIEIANIYHNSLLDHPGVILPYVASNVRHVYHLFVIRSARRDELKDHLKKSGIETGIHYPVALPLLSAYKYLVQNNETSVACSQAENLLSIPIGEHLDNADVEEVINAIHSFKETSNWL
jgi:dTDP-4-amino-4,6-dideoxygalactose transaminase